MASTAEGTADSTADGAVEGGLDDPSGLEPAQGELRLTDPDGADDGHDRAAWEQAAAAVLRKVRRLGDDDPDSAVWDELTRSTLDGIALTPLGTPADLDDLRTAGRPSRAGDWDIRARLGGAPAATLHEEAQGDLEGGVTSLWLTVPGTPEGGWDDFLATALDGVLLDIAPVVLDAPDDAVAAARALLDHASGRDDLEGPLDPRTNLGADPFAAAVRADDAGTGEAAEVDLDALATTARLAADAGVLGVVVDATVVHDLGGSDAQELGYATAAGAAYLRHLTTEAGLDVATAAGLVEFRLAATDEQFPTIAKLRAARRLWARVLELSGVAPEQRAQRQHVVTSRPMMSAYDPYVNLLRTTVAGFAAGVGGADAVTVLPFDTPLGRPETLGRRIARNTSALLISESHVARVADPAGGAYAVERLTDDLAAAGWAEAGRLDDAGGVLAALADGSLRGRVDDVVARRDEAIARRTRPLTGVSEFPDLAAAKPEREPDPSSPPVRRYGAGFEALRDDPPSATVLLATLGPVAAHTARATFATNLLAAGGVTVDVAGATEGPDDLVAAHDGQTVACLAGTDAAYDAWGEAAAAALRGAGVTHVVVAGKPRAWADDACAMGVDALAFLARTREALS